MNTAWTYNDHARGGSLYSGSSDRIFASSLSFVFIHPVTAFSNIFLSLHISAYIPCFIIY